MKNVSKLAVIMAAGLSLAACGVSVPAGTVGVKIKKFGSDAGVQNTPLPVGWNALGLGEDVVEYPSITRTYQWTHATDGDNSVNEEIQFSDNTGLPMTADVSVTVRVDPNFAPKIYTTYKLEFEALLNGPIRSNVRTAISEEAEAMKIEQLYSGGRQQVIQRALARVQKKFAGSGIEISSLDWIGSIRYPAAIQQAIQAKTQADQQALTAQAQVATAEAQARSKIAVAQGDAQATSVLGAALRANPEILERMKIERWNGVLPQVTGGATPMINLR